MDGNFTDNIFENIVESATLIPHSYKDISEDKTGAINPAKYDNFSLRIKFSKTLDPRSVTNDNAALMTGNKRIKTDVNYDKGRNSIIVKPKSNFLRDKLYILKISGKIMTEKGRSLRRHLFYAFKQSGSSLDFYRGFVEKQGMAPNVLPVPRSYMLMLMFILSAAVLVASYLYNYRPGLIAGTALVLVAVAASMIDSISDYGKSHKEYIYGAKLYNKGYYYEALECFELALHYNPTNIYAKYAFDAAVIKSSESS